MKIILNLMIITAVLSCGYDALAFGPTSEDGWRITLGPGVLHEPLYTGSDQYKLQVYPFFDIFYAHQGLELFVGLKDGCGARFIDDETGLFVSAGIDTGQARDRDEEDTKDLLRDTADIQNYFSGFAVAGWDFGFGETAVSVSYFPVKAQYDELDDQHYDALLFSPTIKSGYPILKGLLVLGTFGVSFMDSDYANAYHEVPYATLRLEQFDANAGPESINGELELLYRYNAHFICRFSLIGKRFLGDAQKSPLTRSEYSSESNLTLMYRF